MSSRNFLYYLFVFAVWATLFWHGFFFFYPLNFCALDLDLCQIICTAFAARHSHFHSGLKTL